MEQELPGEIHTKIEQIQKHASQCDLGPSVRQVTDVLQDAGYSEQIAGDIMSPTEGNMQLSDESDKICQGLEEIGFQEDRNTELALCFR